MARQDVPSTKLALRRQRESTQEARARYGALLAGLAAVAFACAGCTKVVVPNVVDQDVDQAKQTLAAAKLKGTISGAQGNIPPGSYVLAQMPAAGEKVAPNSPVELQVETPTPVPDMTNNKLTDAVNTLQNLGLKVAFVKQSTMKLFGGSKVLGQSPAANTLLRKGGIVTLTVATPPDWGSLIGIVTKEPAYAKLNPEYRQYLDQFLK